MKNIALNIEDFVRRSDVLNEKALSDTQMAILKSIYGRPLNDCEREIYCRLTGRPAYEVGKEQREATIIAGRRGGKTTIAVIIALFEAFRDHGLSQARLHTLCCSRSRLNKRESLSGISANIFGTPRFFQNTLKI